MNTLTGKSHILILCHQESSLKFFTVSWLFTQVWKTQKYSPKIWRIGNHKVTALCASLVPLVEGACGFTPSTVLKFWRLLKDNTVYYFTKYSKTANRASYAVSYLLPLLSLD